MHLLVFAHRAEAQTFLKNEKLKAHDKISSLYVGDKLCVLITGEGFYSAITNLSYSLALIPHVTDVINLGICGAFHEEVEVGSIHKIRTIYAEDEYKSFTPNNERNIDIITTKQRVLDTQEAKKHSHIANLVDREAWAYAYVCKELGKTFDAIKLVSDHITDAAICEIIKENAQEYSEKLYEFYLNSYNLNVDLHVKDLNLIKDPLFYFSLSQKRQYVGLIDLLNKKHNQSEKEILNQIDLEGIKSEEALPKQRTRLLLEELNKLLYPYKTKIQNALNKLTCELENNGAVFKFDKDLEKKAIHFSAQIDNDVQLERIAHNLKVFPWQRFVQIMDGDIDV